MKKTVFPAFLSLILCLVLTAAVALSMVSCDNQTEAEQPQGESASSSVSESASEGASESSSESDTVDPDAPIVKGEGDTVFSFTVVDGEGKETAFEIHTDKTIVGEALLAVGLIEGEDGAYGLYVKRVNGILADYDVNQTYWAFYVNGEYGMTGVDQTEITAGDTYMFKVSK